VPRRGAKGDKRRAADARKLRRPLAYRLSNSAGYAAKGGEAARVVTPPTAGGIFPNRFYLHDCIMTDRGLPVVFDPNRAGTR
jgi:hypothetical protein